METNFRVCRDAHLGRSKSDGLICSAGGLPERHLYHKQYAMLLTLRHHGCMRIMVQGFGALTCGASGLPGRGTPRSRAQCRALDFTASWLTLGIMVQGFGALTCGAGGPPGRGTPRSRARCCAIDFTASWLILRIMVQGFGALTCGAGGPPGRGAPRSRAQCRAARPWPPCALACHASLQTPPPSAAAHTHTFSNACLAAFMLAGTTLIRRFLCAKPAAQPGPCMTS